MAPLPGTPSRRSGVGRPRSTRPKSTAAWSENSPTANFSSEPPLKKRRYIPGGPGGGGRYVDEDGTELQVGGTGPGGYNYVGSRGRVGRQNAAMGLIPEVYNRRKRSTRARTVLSRPQQSSMRYSSAAQAAAVVQSDAHKPREERAWEEFHPNLDIDLPLRAFSAAEVEGIPPSLPNTISALSQSGTVQALNGTEGHSTSDGSTNPLLFGQIDISTLRIPGTPGGGKRRPGRPPKDPVAFFAAKAAKAAKLGKEINIGPLKIPNISHAPPYLNPKERLTLPQPSYRKSNTLARFRDEALGLVRSIDKSMADVGYQESDIFIRPQKTLIKVSDINLEDELDLGPDNKTDGGRTIPARSCGVGRVEYDMDEQDDKWLDNYNSDRKSAGLDNIKREIFEITITKIEKEWHNLEKRIPKANPKPPQTHRPRSSSAAAVNGEALAGEEQDSKCAVCDDGDCENTNAIVFCDGCDLAVHQECYGVPFIPEGQWLCRKCQLIGRSVPTCIFCPNTDGAFKQTNASKWAHLLCAMWIPEVSLGNHTFMEPVMEVEKVPKTRWKLTCYLCNQRMGACIQCGNKSCYQAFHVTCARKARFFLKMKNNQGMLSVLDDTTSMKAFCDKHCPPEWAKENDVANATREARAFYKKAMRGRLWADSQASALEIAAQYCHANNENQSHEPHIADIKTALALGDLKKKDNQPQKPIWKLPSGAPVIPFCVFENVEKSLGRFKFQGRYEYTADVCRYWTLKREARRGAALLKRLQLQMETFSSFEITRRNFAGMGPVGRPRLEKRIEFAKKLLKDIERLKELSETVAKRESEMLNAAELEVEFVDTVYFPIANFFPPIIDLIIALDVKKIFAQGIMSLQSKVKARFYTTVMPFAQDLCDLFRSPLTMEPGIQSGSSKPLSDNSRSEISERRKLIRKILSQAVQPNLENAVRAEAEISCKPVDEMLKGMLQLLGSVWQVGRGSVSKGPDTSPDSDTGLQIAGTSHDLCSPSLEGHKKIRKIESFENKVPESNASNNITWSEHPQPTPAELDDQKSLISTEMDFIIKPEVIHDALSVKSDNLNNLQGLRKSPGNGNSCVLLSETPHPALPTPPVSNVDTGLNPDEVLSIGGVPWIFKDFHVKGTTSLHIEVACSPNGELSDNNEDDFRGLGEQMNRALKANSPANHANTKKDKMKSGWSRN